MKITKVDLQGFRAFDEPFTLDLKGGKNLLLYGENGSGKSSIFFALKRFFEELGDDVSTHRNRFSQVNRAVQVRIYTRHTEGGAEQTNDFLWDETNGHPLSIPNDPAAAPITPEQRSLLVDAARRAGFLDYRSMLRTHLLASPLPRTHNYPTTFHDNIYGTESQGLEELLFDLVSMVILDGVRTTVPGGGESTLGNLMRQVWGHRPKTRRKSTLSMANGHTTTFNQAFNAKLSELEGKLSDFLNYFHNHHLSIKFQQVSLSWDNKTLMLQGAELIPELTFRGQPADDYRSFLNEARLSALAISLFLAGVVLSDNDFDNPDHPRFLFLDDALIGLELQNRLPVLKILTSDHFKHYQIFLLTHDRVWYDLARAHLRQRQDWLHRELFANENDNCLVPCLKRGEDDLAMAKEHLDNNDLRAAAVYARAAFEARIQKVCEKKGIEISYRRDPKEVTLDKLWSGILARQNKRKSEHPTSPEFIPQSLIDEVEVMRSNVLNALSHSGPPGLNKAEVKAAIDTVEKLQRHPFPNS